MAVGLAGNGTGSVKRDPAGAACAGICTAAYTFGQRVWLTAMASDTATFAGWSGACSGLSPGCRLDITGTLHATATFTGIRMLLPVVVKH